MIAQEKKEKIIIVIIFELVSSRENQTLLRMLLRRAGISPRPASPALAWRQSRSPVGATGLAGLRVPWRTVHRCARSA